MKKDLIDFINYLARDIPPGELNSTGLKDDVIAIFEMLVNELSLHEILFEQTVCIATTRRIKNHITNKMLSKKANLPMQYSQYNKSRRSVQKINSRLLLFLNGYCFLYMGLLWDKHM